eukprot:m.360599 g.360599  ORF g.360599 m.360599 type:complete len:268 (+) comp19118_c0_seq1:35-838(+)
MNSQRASLRLVCRVMLVGILAVRTSATSASPTTGGIAEELTGTTATMEAAKCEEACSPVPEMNPSNTIILVALKDELPAEAAAPWRVRYTGVGKVLAAIRATQAILEEKPEHVINFGTAGALGVDFKKDADKVHARALEEVKGLARVSHVYQRDMDVRPLGFDLGHTPYENIHHFDLGAEGVSVGSGDQFVTSKPDLVTDLVEMEAYAIARACHEFDVKFHSWKYVSDSADDAAPMTWEESVAHGSHLFVDTVLKPLLKTTEPASTN